MPDPQLTDTQTLLRDTVREFMAREVAPVRAEIEQRCNPSEAMPWDLIRAGSRIGLRTMALPEEFDGISADVLTRAVVMSEMCRVESGLAKCFYGAWRGSVFIYQLGTPAQREKFLRPFIEDDTYLFGTALTEPDAGSDNLIPSEDPGRGIRLSAVREGDEWVLNGRKQWLSLGGFAKGVLVYARTNRTVPVHQGSTLFVVPWDWPGVSFPHLDDKLGFRLYPNGELILDDVRVPDDHRLGKVDAALVYYRLIFGGSVDYPATSLGLAKGMYDIALEYAKGRVQGGCPIIEHQTVGALLAEMRMHIETMESYLWDTARAIDSGRPYDANQTWLLKVFCDRAVVAVMLGALEITAGSGCMREFGLEHFCRDVLTSLHSDGTDVFNLVRAARVLVQESRGGPGGALLDACYASVDRPLPDSVLGR